MSAVSGLVVPDVGQDLVVVDVEGNGAQPPDIVEIAVLRLDRVDAGREVHPAGVRSWLVRPARPISAVVTRKVHGIGNDDVASAPRWRQVAAQVQSELGARALVAHSATVERDVVAAHLPDWRPALVVDTLRMARAVLPGVRGGHGLDNLISVLRLPGPPGQPAQDSRWRRHRAAYDVWMTACLLRALLAEAGPNPSAVLAEATLTGPRHDDRPAEGSARAPWSWPDGGLW